MKFLGIMFICCGFACWLIGAKRLTERTLKRYGIMLREFPIAPFAIPFRKFNRQEWRQLVFLFLASMLLLNVGRALLLGV